MWWYGAAWASDGQLVDPVWPVSQRIELAIDPARTTAAGRTTIVLDVHAEVDRFLVHAAELEIESATLQRFGGRAKPVVLTPAGPGLMEVAPTEPLTPGTWDLEITYTAPIHDQPYGLYRFEVGGEWFVVSQFQPDDARTAWPCFDEPRFKIPFTVTVTAPTGLAVVANAPVASRTVKKGGLAVQFEPSEPIPSYALALAVGPYVARPVDGLPLATTIYTAPGREPVAEGMADALPSLYYALEAWFGSPPPYPKNDLVVVPEFAYGAMENPGAMVFAEWIVPPPGSTSVDRTEYASHVIAHELAHLWFGDWVTMTWWDDLWLNEAFAEWMGRRTVDRVHPEWDGALSRVSRAYDMLHADASAATRPLRTEVDPNAVFETANFAVYDKGEALLEMVVAWIGEPVAQEALRAYLTRHASGNARAADLFLALGDASGEDVAAVFDPFLDTPGAPWLSFTRRADGAFDVDQRPLSVRGEPAPAGGPWTVPVRLRIGRPDGSTEVVTRLLGREPEVWDLGEVATLHPAADGIGYYGWSLDDAELAALLGTVGSLADPERLALVRMLELEWVAGRRSLVDTLRLLDGFEHEQQAGVLRAVVRVVDQVALVEDGTDLALVAAANRYRRDQLRPMLDRVGRAPRAGESPSTVALRTELVASLADAQDARVRAELVELGRRLLSDPAAAPPDEATLALAVFAEDGGPAALDALLAAAERAEPSRRDELLFAAGRVGTTAGWRAALDWALRDSTPYSQMMPVLNGVMSRGREVDRDAILTRLLDGWDAVVAKSPPVSLRYAGWFASGCDPARVERAAAFFEPLAIPGVDESLAGAAADARACQVRRAAEEAGLRALLSYFAGP
ncbi:MAG: M1 family metallopeptidase [Myxococcota bacterium]